ncbi:MAG: hypothetical protein H0X51_00855 [Parachlamydiaceae bacterium]|nr:hypothetical protein [Parachlamydiaceae bacterium]
MTSMTSTEQTDSFSSQQIKLVAHWFEQATKGASDADGITEIFLNLITIRNLPQSEQKVWVMDDGKTELTPKQKIVHHKSTFSFKEAQNSPKFYPTLFQEKIAAAGLFLKEALAHNATLHVKITFKNGTSKSQNWEYNKFN